MTDPSFELEVLEVVEETGDARSVVLDPGEHREHFDYTPGQFLTVAVPSDQTGLVARSYSLSSTPGDGGPLTITVKRTADGYASGWICENLKAGDKLRVLPPSGIFTPKDLDVDLLLFAGGSGITPVMSIIRAALADGVQQDRLVLCQPRRAVGDLPRLARRAVRRTARPSSGRALARVRAGPADAGAAAGVRLGLPRT